MSDFTRVYIQGPDGLTRILKERAEYAGQGRPEDLLQQLTAERDPFSDYFIFQDSEGGLHVIRSDASRFSLAGRRLEDFKIQINRTETVAKKDVQGHVTGLEEVPLKLVKVVDQAGQIKISKVNIQIGSEKPLPHEVYLKEKLEEYFAALLKEKKAFSGKEFREAMGVIAPLLEGMALLFFTPEGIPLPAQMEFLPGGDGEYVFTLKFKGAPRSLHLENFDHRLAEEARAFLDKAMNHYYQAHPAVANRELSNVDGSARSAIAPTMGMDDLTWYYPPDAAQIRYSPIGAAVVEFLHGRDPRRMPPLDPGGIMPVSQVVVLAFQQWLNARLEKEPGNYNLQVISKDNQAGYTLRLEEKPFDEIRISDRDVAILKVQFNIDISEEKRELDGGTADWSRRAWNHFLKKLQAKYRKSGVALKMDGKLLKSFDDGKSFWIQAVWDADANRARITPLLPRDKAAFVGDDLNLPGMPSAEILKTKLFGSEPYASQREFSEGLARVGEAIHQADYLLASTFPNSNEEGFIPMHISGERVAMEIRLALQGRVSIRVEGGLQETSIRALEKGLAWEEGKPFRPQVFEKRLARALERLHLQIDEEVEYFYRDGKILDVNIPLIRPNSFVGAGGAVDARTGEPVATGELILSHKVPHTSQATLSAQVGKNVQEITLYTKTLPVTQGGTRVVASVGGEHFRVDGDQPVDFWSVGPSVTLLVPLGKEGLSSPWQLHLPVRARWIQRETKKESDQQTFVGSGAGVSYLDGGVLTRKDLLSFFVGQDYDREMHGRSADTTSKVKTSYKHPLHVGRLFLEWQIYGYHRQNLQGEQLSPYRVHPGIEAPIDYAQGLSRRPHERSVTLGAHVQRSFGWIVPFAGVTWSAARELNNLGEPTGSHHRMGVGLGAQLNVLGGMTVYLGWEVMEDGEFKKPDPVPNLGFALRIRL